MRHLRALAALGMAVACSVPSVALAAEERNDAIRDQLINFKDIPALIKNPRYIDIKYNNADLREVLRYIAKQGGMNMILDDSVQGKVTIDVRAMPLDEFLSLMLRTNQLGARRVGTSLLVAKADQIAAKIDDTQAATIRLNNAAADQVMSMLKEIISKSTKLVSDPRTNSLLIVGTGEDITKIKNAIKAIDVPAPQVIIEVKLVEVQSSLARTLGGEFGFGGSKFGVSNNVSDPSITSNGNPSAGVPSSPGGTSITFSAMGNVTSNLNARINAMVKSGTAKVLASPRIATQDSQQASIKLVNKVPVIQVNFTGGGNGGGALAAENVEFKEIGEQLTITPRIDTNGFVTMELAPTISVRGKDVIVNRNPVPEINERSLKTKMRVADGETVVIGGLIRRNQNNSQSKMPLLGDIPVIGFLFKQDANDFTENEVIIMVTPHITTERAPAP